MGKQWKSKITKLASGHFTFWKCYVQGPPRKKQYRHFFGGVLNVSRIIDFYTCNLDKEKTKKETNFIFCSIFKVVFRGCPKKELMSLLYIIFRIIDFYTSNFGKKWQNDLNKLEWGHFTSSKCYIQHDICYMLHERSNYNFGNKCVLYKHFR